MASSSEKLSDAIHVYLTLGPEVHPNPARAVLEFPE
jgi:hypothetical protein